MKGKRRILCVLMIMCMLLSCSAFSVSAATRYTVKVPATQSYSDAQKVLKLINRQRSKRGLVSLKLDQSLCKAAAQRAAELAIYIPEGSPHRRPNGALAKSVNGRIIYECCAEGYETPKDVMYGWMTSAPHKKGILLSNARSVGIGCITTKNGIKFWTLEFSSSGASKVVKSKSKVTSNYKVSTLASHFKKSNFSLGLASTEDIWLSEEIEVGQTVRYAPFFNNNYDFVTQLKPTDYTWRSAKKSVATVDSKGRVTAKKAGRATIYATMKSAPKYKLKITINVVKSYYDDDDDCYYYDY